MVLAASTARCHDVAAQRLVQTLSFLRVSLFQVALFLQEKVTQRQVASFC
jgi:hypothetical protein